jgi:hypothetical protein
MNPDTPDPQAEGIVDQQGEVLHEMEEQQQAPTAQEEADAADGSGPGEGAD